MKTSDGWTRYKIAALQHRRRSHCQDPVLLQFYSGLELCSDSPTGIIDFCNSLYDWQPTASHFPSVHRRNGEELFPFLALFLCTCFTSVSAFCILFMLIRVWRPYQDGITFTPGLENVTPSKVRSNWSFVLKLGFAFFNLFTTLLIYLDQPTLIPLMGARPSLFYIESVSIVSLECFFHNENAWLSRRYVCAFC